MVVGADLDCCRPIFVLSPSILNSSLKGAIVAGSFPFNASIGRRHYCYNLDMRIREMDAGYNLNRSRRIDERKDYQKEVLFSTGSIFFLGKIKNISKDGARVGSRNIPKLSPGVEIFIAIPLSKKQGSIKRKAIVMWANMDQFGIKFNKRKNVRKNYQREIIISTGSMIFPGRIQNISMGGAHVDSRNISITKTPVVLNVSIPYAKKQGSVKRKAIVRWAKNDQFGIQFI